MLFHFLMSSFFTPILINSIALKRIQQKFFNNEMTVHRINKKNTQHHGVAKLFKLQGEYEKNAFKKF